MIVVISSIYIREIPTYLYSIAYIHHLLAVTGQKLHTLQCGDAHLSIYAAPANAPPMAYPIL